MIRREPAALRLTETLLGESDYTLLFRGGVLLMHSPPSFCVAPMATTISFRNNSADGRTGAPTIRCPDAFFHHTVPHRTLMGLDTARGVMLPS